MKYGKIFTYENRNEAEIGKKYVFSDLYMNVCDGAIDTIKLHSELKAVKDQAYPFGNDRRFCSQFIREIIEESDLMTHRQMAELLAKGYGEWRHTGDETIFPSSLYTENYENKPVDGDIRIRRWGYKEWLVPTVDIYNGFCHPVCKEDC